MKAAVVVVVVLCSSGCTRSDAAKTELDVSAAANKIDKIDKIDKVDKVGKKVPRNPKGHTEAEDLERQQKNLAAATTAFATGQFVEANVTASRALGADPPAEIALEALWIRGRARVALGRADAAKADLQRFLNEASPTDARRSEVQKVLDGLRK
jgi:hypothetical protein